jgi:hypothetical protein
MVILRANEEWRKDPKRLEDARNIAIALGLAYENHARKLKEAQKTLEVVYRAERVRTGHWTDHGSFGKMIEDAERKAEHYGNPTDTLIGNMAAFGEGTN